MTLRTADSHCHFFSSSFFSRLADERDGDGSEAAAQAVTRMLGWDYPGTPGQLADRWVEELDHSNVASAALIASVVGDQGSVAKAVARHPDRLAGLFVVDPSAADVEESVRKGLSDQGLAGPCLFPAMHRFSLTEPSVDRVFATVAEHPAGVVFVHCGALSVGVRKRLGLASPFESFRANPLHLEPLARRYSDVWIIIPHFGAGPFREALMLCDLCPNVLLDTSSSNGWIRYHPGLDLEGVFARTLDVAGPERVLFGSDSSFFPRGWNQEVLARQTEALERIGASTREQELILGGNFERIFRVPGPSGSPPTAGLRAGC